MSVGDSEKSARWAIVFLETSEERPTPETLRTMLLRLKEEGLFDGIEGVLFGKPQNEVYFEEYKAVLCDVLARDIPILYNLNFGHGVSSAFSYNIRKDITISQYEKV